MAAIGGFYLMRGQIGLQKWQMIGARNASLGSHAIHFDMKRTFECVLGASVLVRRRQSICG